MKFVVIDTNGGLFSRPQILRAESFKSALRWCFANGYDLIEQL